MFIDYVALMLVNMAAGLVMLALYVLRGMDGQDAKKWVPGFAIVGAIAAVFGTHMCWTWPLMGSYNLAFGEMAVLMGVLYLAIAWAVGRGWSLSIIGVYAVFAGLAAIVVGLSIMNLHMTRTPMLSGTGFILSGLGGVLLGPSVWLKRNRAARKILAVVLLGAAVIWALTAYPAYWAHMKMFSDWKPTTTLAPPAAK